MSTKRRTYYRSGELLTASIATLLALVTIAIGAPLLWIALMICIAGILIYSAFQIRLVTTPNEIEYYQVGYSVRTTWSNLARIGEIPAGRIMAEGLILHEPALSVARVFCRVKYIQTRARVIPLSLFDRN